MTIDTPEDAPDEVPDPEQPGTADRSPWLTEFTAPDGTTHAVRRLVLPGGERFDAEFVAIAQPLEFDRCPLCLALNPRRREHIPPESVGGTVLTRTCERCNSLAGSRLEADFADWVHDRLPTRFTHNKIQGQRRGPRIQILETHEGQPVLLFEGEQCDPAVPEMLRLGGEVNVEFTTPDPDRSHLAAIKSAYLSACLIVQAIPETPEAEAIRQVLLTAIETPRHQPVPMTGLPDGMWLARIPGPGVRGEAALVRVTIEGGGEPKFAIMLARKILVAWPIGGNLVGTDANDNVTFALPM
ncbi:hypothetical protein [Glycomyces sp. NPDC048151]|uniref:hypothetical protein n=1 Tax=Glycomyces sp. NPDC048151 TaxID=3364002 RepID=UPI0037216A5A